MTQIFVVFIYACRMCLLPAWQPNGISPTVKPCPGFGVDSPFPSSVLQFSASGVPAPAVDMQPSPRLHHWTWSFLSSISSKLLLSYIAIDCVIINFLSHWLFTVLRLLWIHYFILHLCSVLCLVVPCLLNGYTRNVCTI